MPLEDTWYWDEMLEMALSLFHYTENEFWKLRPIKFISLLRAYGKRNNGENTPNKDRIDNKPKRDVVDTTIDEMPDWWG